MPALTSPAVPVCASYQAKTNRYRTGQWKNLNLSAVDFINLGRAGIIGLMDWIYPTHYLPTSAGLPWVLFYLRDRLVHIGL